MQRQLALDRLDVVDQDTERLLQQLQGPESVETAENPATNNPELSELIKNREYAKSAHRILDETLAVATNTLDALNQQGSALHQIHQQLLGVTSKMMVGDKSLAQIIRLENFGVFIGGLGVTVIVIVWLLIKFVF